MCLLKIFSHFKEILYFLVTVGGLLVAVLGLKTWRKQIKGKTEYEAARKLYKAVLQLRDGISFVRNPFIPVSEMVKAEEQYKKENPNATSDSNNAVYQARWNKIVEAMSAVELELLEAEVLWGKEIKEVIKPVLDCVKKLNITLFKFLNPQFKISNHENLRTIMYEINNPSEKDEFTVEVVKAVEKVADYLKPKINM